MNLNKTILLALISAMSCERPNLTNKEVTTIYSTDVQIVRTYLDGTGLLSLDIPNKTLYIYENLAKGAFPKTPATKILYLDEIQITTDRCYHCIHQGIKVLSICGTGPTKHAAF